GEGGDHLAQRSVLATDERHVGAADVLQRNDQSVVIERHPYLQGGQGCESAAPSGATVVLKARGFTTRTSQGIWSSADSAVLPMRRRSRPRRDTAPITTTSAASFRAVCGMTSAGSPAARCNRARG